MLDHEKTPTLRNSKPLIKDFGRLAERSRVTGDVEGVEGTVSVYDIYGRMVLTTNSNTLDISQAATGIYFVRVVDEQGRVYTAKVVKE